MAKFILCVIMAITTVMNAGRSSTQPFPETCPFCEDGLSGDVEHCPFCGSSVENDDYQIAVSSENFTVDEMMMNYFVAYTIQPYKQYLSLLNIDKNSSLKTQQYSHGRSWYDYFIEQTMDTVEKYLALCEYARANGIELSEEDMESIDAQIATFTDAAKEHGYTTNMYLSYIIADGVTVDVLRRCFEIENLSSLAYAHYNKNIEYTAKELLDYRDTNPELFLGVDYLTYTFELTEFTKYDESGNKTSSTTEDFIAARSAATALSKAENPQEFLDAIRSHTTQIYGEDAAYYYNPEKRHHTRDYFSEKVAKWAFAAAEGDTMVEIDSDGTYISVYMITKTPYIDESPTRSARQICMTREKYMDYSEVEKVYSEWEASGFSDDVYDRLEAEYSEYAGGSGAYYYNVPYGMLIEEFEEWIFDPERQVGDRDIVVSSYGWHIFEYLGEGECSSWEAIALKNKTSEDFEAMIEEEKEKIICDYDVINSLDF